MNSCIFIRVSSHAFEEIIVHSTTNLQATHRHLKSLCKTKPKARTSSIVHFYWGCYHWHQVARTKFPPRSHILQSSSISWDYALHQNHPLFPQSVHSIFSTNITATIWWRFIITHSCCVTVFWCVLSSSKIVVLQDECICSWVVLLGVILAIKEITGGHNFCGPIPSTSGY